MKKFCISGFSANKGVNFFIVIFNFSLVKAEMNAPHLCKLRKDCLTRIGHITMVLTKCPDKDHCALANCGGVEFLKLR
jgi:hypothetical protein